MKIINMLKSAKNKLKSRHEETKETKELKNIIKNSSEFKKVEKVLTEIENGKHKHINKKWVSSFLKDTFGYIKKPIVSQLCLLLYMYFISIVAMLEQMNIKPNNPYFKIYIKKTTIAFLKNSICHLITMLGGLTDPILIKFLTRSEEKLKKINLTVFTEGMKNPYLLFSEISWVFCSLIIPLIMNAKARGAVEALNMIQGLGHTPSSEFMASLEKDISKYSAISKISLMIGFLLQIINTAALIAIGYKRYSPEYYINLAKKASKTNETINIYLNKLYEQNLVPISISKNKKANDFINDKNYIKDFQNLDSFKKLNKGKKDLLKKMGPIKNKIDVLMSKGESSKNEYKELNNELIELNNELQDANERIEYCKEFGRDPGKRRTIGGTIHGGEPGKRSHEMRWDEKINNWTFSNFFSSVPGATYLGKKLKVSKSLGGGVVTLAGVALAAALIYTSYRVYQIHSSKGWKECRNLKFRDRWICIKKYELKGINARILDLYNVIKYCDKTNEPRNCKTAITRRILSLKSKRIGIMKFLAKRNEKYF